MIQNNLKRSKIVEIRDKEYAQGNVFFLKIRIGEKLNQAIMSFLTSLGFSKDSLEEFDREYKNEEFFIFSIEKNTRVCAINGSSEREMILLIDGNLEKEHLIKKAETYFQVFD